MVIQQSPTNGFFLPRETTGFSAANVQPIPGETSPRFPMSYMAQSTCTAIVSPTRQIRDITGGETTRYTPGILGRYSTSPPLDGKPEVGDMWYDGYFPATRPYYPYNGYGTQARYAPTTMHDHGQRKNATRESTSTLKAWLQEHSKNPYPSKGEKVMLAVVSKMTLTQVSTWFANARRRLKKENKMTWIPKHRPNDSTSLSSQPNSACDQSSLSTDTEIDDKISSESRCPTVTIGGESSSPIPQANKSQGSSAAILNQELEHHRTNHLSQTEQPMYYPCNTQSSWEGTNIFPKDAFQCSQPICRDPVHVPGNHPYLPSPVAQMAMAPCIQNSQQCQQTFQSHTNFATPTQNFCQAPTKNFCDETNLPFTQHNSHVIANNQSQWLIPHCNGGQEVSCFPAAISQSASKPGSIPNCIDGICPIRSREGALSTGHCSEGTDLTDWYSSKNGDSSPEPQCDLQYGIHKSSWEAPMKFGQSMPTAQQQVW